MSILKTHTTNYYIKTSYNYEVIGGIDYIRYPSKQ